MEKIKNAFDDFTIGARVLPAITVVLPLAAIGLYRGILDNEWTEASVEFALALIAIIFLSNIVREWGKSYENKMYKRLNAKPTTIVMRFSDDKIDEISKIKYHQWFNSKGGHYRLPLSLEEELVDTQSDNKYINATKDLRVYANAHRDEVPRVYQELKKYNYWRNLYGCKKFAVVMYLLLIVRELLTIETFQIKDIVLNPIPRYSVLVGVAIWTIVYCIVVTEKVVERNAFDYAITLVETICDVDEK